MLERPIHLGDHVPREPLVSERLVHPRRNLPCSVDPGADLVDLFFGVLQLFERWSDRLVDQGHRSAACEALVLHEREVGLGSRRVAVHLDGDRARGSDG